MLKRIAYFLKRFIWPHRWLFLVVLCTGMLTAATSGLGIPLMVKFVFPLVFAGNESPEVLRYLPSLASLEHEVLLMLACAFIPFVFFLRGISGWLNSVMVSLLGLRVLENIRMAVFGRVQELPMPFLEARRKGDLLSRVVADTSNVQGILTQVSNDLVKQPITCFCAVAAFIWLLFSGGQGLLFFANVAFISLAAWPIITFGRRIAAKSRRAQAGIGELNTVVQQNLETQREVRAYAMENRQIADFNAASENYGLNVVKLVKYQRALIPVMEFTTALALAFLMVRGHDCGMTLTDFLAMAASLFFAFDSLKRAGTAFNRFNEAQGSLERLDEVLREPNSMPDPEQPVKLSGSVRGDIRFNNVSFAYTEGGQKVLREVNVHIPAGQIVGLVGPSGAGKTTFASLIPRFYDATEGSVEIDGVDVRHLTKHDLREQMALVGQQALLFTGTIAENIGLGRLTATREEIEKAADAAAVTPFLAALADGIDTKLGDGGSGISGGQRQRVAIARAFVKDAPILILDEATASLDAESERDIQQELDKLAQGRTTLIVAHRFSTLRNAHRILVFDHGCIIGDGPHEELYATCPLYKELYDRQGI